MRTSVIIHSDKDKIGHKFPHKTLSQKHYEKYFHHFLLNESFREMFKDQERKKKKFLLNTRKDC